MSTTDSILDQRLSPPAERRGAIAEHRMLVAREIQQRIELHHRLERDESALVAALAVAQAELEHRMRSAWLGCLHEDVMADQARARCDAFQAEVERIERELCQVRSALAASAAELVRRAPRAAMRARITAPTVVP